MTIVRISEGKIAVISPLSTRATHRAYIPWLTSTAIVCIAITIGTSPSSRTVTDPPPTDGPGSLFVKQNVRTTSSTTLSLYTCRCATTWVESRDLFPSPRVGSVHTVSHPCPTSYARVWSPTKRVGTWLMERRG